MPIPRADGAEALATPPSPALPSWHSRQAWRPRRLPTPRAAPSGHPARLGAGDPQQLVEAGREDRVRGAGGGPDDVEARELLVDDGVQRRRVPDGRDAADGEARDVADDGGVGALHPEQGLVAAV